MTTLAGQGEPVILIHSLGTGARIWDPVVARLQEHLQVITYDLRGHGDPGWEGEAYTVEDCARDLDGLLAELRLDSAHVWGLTLGGSIAAVYAGMYPARVRTLTVADATGWYGEGGFASWEARARATLTTPREDQFRASVPLWFTPPFIAQHPEEIERIRGVYMGTSNAGHAAACLALGRLDARPWVGKITAPTLVMTGEMDTRTPPEMGRVLADSIPGARFELLPGLAHLTPLESNLPTDKALAHILGASQ